MLTRAHRIWFFGNSRQKLLSLCLLAVLGTPVSARDEQYAGSSSPAVNLPAFDPNGLEADGAGAVERATSLETTDLTLLTIWAALALTMAGTALADKLRSRQAADFYEEKA
jgi:hypothetical protein